MTRSAFSLLFTGSALAFTSGLVQAQSQSSANDESHGGLEEIVVTAQRRTEDQQHAAASISVRTGADLLAQGKYQLSAIIDDVPGITGGASIAPAGQGNSAAGTDSPAAGLIIRGIPSNSGVGGANTSVATAAAIYVDGIYNGSGGAFDIDRVEVLRGPQGTLYGRSATAGVVAISTRNPNLEEPEGFLSAELGNYEARHYSGGVSIPVLKDQFAVRVSGNYYDRQGYYSDEGGAVTNRALRVKALLNPTDNLSALVGYTQEDNDQNAGGVTFSLTTPNTYVATSTPISTGSNELRQYWAELNWDIDDLTFTYLPAYRTYSNTAQSKVILGVLNTDQFIDTPKNHFTTHEMRLTSQKGDRLTWLVGALHYDNELSNSTVARNGSNGALQYDSNTGKHTKAIGVFGEATYAFTDTWRLTGGLRYDDTDVRVNQIYTVNVPQGVLPENNVTYVLSGDAGVRGFQNWTYKLRLEHDLTPHNLVYALTSTGFSPGDLGVTGGADGLPTTVLFEDETLRAYEIGAKNRFLNNRLQVNGAVFYYVYSGFQAANVSISSNPTTPLFATMEAPARAYGAELETLFRPTTVDRLGLNLAYAHAYFSDMSGVVPGTGGRHFSDYFGYSEIPGVVPFTAQLSYDRNIDLPGGSTINLRGVVRYRDAYKVERLSPTQIAAGLLPYTWVDDQVIGDLSATWNALNDRFSATVYVRNVDDNRFKRTISFLGGTATTNLSDPRTFGIVLSARM